MVSDQKLPPLYGLFSGPPFKVRQWVLNPVSERQSIHVKTKQNTTLQLRLAGPLDRFSTKTRNAQTTEADISSYPRGGSFRARLRHISSEVWKKLALLVLASHL